MWWPFYWLFLCNVNRDCCYLFRFCVTWTTLWSTEVMVLLYKLTLTWVKLKKNIYEQLERGNRIVLLFVTGCVVSLYDSCWPLKQKFPISYHVTDHFCAYNAHNNNYRFCLAWLVWCTHLRQNPDKDEVLSNSIWYSIKSKQRLSYGTLHEYSNDNNDFLMSWLLILKILGTTNRKQNIYCCPECKGTNLWLITSNQTSNKEKKNTHRHLKKNRSTARYL